MIAANYEKTFLLTLEDVENAFVAHTAAVEQSNRFLQAEQACRYSDALFQATTCRCWTPRPKRRRVLP